MDRTDVVIAGVNKAGTTSLFVSLAEHPDVAPSAIKETRYFLPARYGDPLPPRQQWEQYFTSDAPVRLEATPSYFYGGAAVATAMTSVLTEPACRARAAGAGGAGDLVLRVPEGAPAVPGLADHGGVPRRGRRAR